MVLSVTCVFDKTSTRPPVRTGYRTQITVPGGDVTAPVFETGDDATATNPRIDQMTDLENEWAAVEDDPDLEQDLGYRQVALETVVAEQYDQLLFLPIDDDGDGRDDDGDDCDDVLEPDAFIAADESIVVDLADTR